MQFEEAVVGRAPMTENETRQYAMFLHMSLVGSFVVPVLGILLPTAMWFVKKGRSERLDLHGATVVDVALCYHGALFVAALLAFYVTGPLLFIALLAALVSLAGIAAVKANDGELWTYPCTKEFVRRR